MGRTRSSASSPSEPIQHTTNEHQHSGAPPTLAPRKPRRAAPPSAALLAALAALPLLADASPAPPRRRPPPGFQLSDPPHNHPSETAPRAAHPDDAHLPPFLAPSLSRRQRGPRAEGLPTRFLPTTDGWQLAEGWVLHGKSYDQRDGTANYNPDGEDGIEVGDSNTDVASFAGTLATQSSSTAFVAAATSSTATPSRAVSASSSVHTTTATGTSTASKSTHTTTSATPSYSPTDLPTGWEPSTPRTQYYVVPLIIALSVLLAVLIVTAIGGCVWQHQHRRTKGGAEKERGDTDSVAGSAVGKDVDVERLRRGVEREMERRRKALEKEARKEMRVWVSAEDKWRARLFLRRRGGKKRKAGSLHEGEGVAAATAAPREDENVGTSTAHDHHSEPFARSSAPSPSTNRPSTSRPSSPSPSIPPAYPQPASPTTPTALPLYPSLPPAPPPPPASLRALVVPSRAHIATDDKRVLGVMARARWGPDGTRRESVDEHEGADVPEWTDEEVPEAEAGPSAPPPEPEPPSPNSPDGRRARTPPPAFSYPFPAPPPPLPALHYASSSAFSTHSDGRGDGEDVYGGASAPEMDEFEGASAPDFVEEEEASVPELEEEEE